MTKIIRCAFILSAIATVIYVYTPVTGEVKEALGLVAKPIIEILNNGVAL